jgi:hypothetical protein
MRDSELFDKAVTTYFGPIAQKLGLPFTKVRDGIYEISSSYFIMRIRLHTGHARGLNVILRPTSLENYDESKPGGLGIGCLMQFNGENSKPLSGWVRTNEDFLKLTQLHAQAAERFGIPYLIGEKDDFEAVRESMTKRGEADLSKLN